MLRLPPTSTLFPYTTLFRSGPLLFSLVTRHTCAPDPCTRVRPRRWCCDLRGWGCRACPAGPLDLLHPGRHLDGGGPLPERSEEHTSELQSHSDLVCRLLLEK